MKRIRDQASSPDPVMARAASLLAAVPPLDPAHVRPRHPPFDARPRPGTAQVRLAFALALTLASAVAGAATWHRTGWVGLFARPVAGPSPTPPPLPAALAPIVRVPAAPPAAPSPTVGPAETPAVVGAVAGSSAARVMPPTALGSTPKDSRDARTPAAAGAEESALVIDAVRALRRDHDPVRAGNLAQEALQRYPRGAQVEEAMAVAMEAASANGDATAARRWAERYLDAFGTGRFADRARQLLAASPR